ncbi:MAG: hypothetical protein GY869_07230 [Planctomycetes bacterium]|nr:hypothetical protein [Planctomycetota bacterium]
MNLPAKGLLKNLPPFTITDNGGAGLDRYMVLFEDGDSLTMSADWDVPQGFSPRGGSPILPDPEKGKIITLDDLPPGVRHHVLKQIDYTAKVIEAQLKENTGRHFLDSGGHYGRHWQGNQDRDFAQEPPGTLGFDHYSGHPEIGASLNLYHWLNERLEFDYEMQQWFDQFCEQIDPDNKKHWLELMERFPGHLRSRDPEFKVGGLYGEGDPFTVNTYNGPDLLSQVIQFLYFEVNGDPSVLLQMHGGCDVRGGYTAPKAYRGLSELAILDNARAGINCTRQDDDPKPPDLIPGAVDHHSHSWQTDDAYHWYRDGACGLGAGTELQEYAASDDPQDRGQGKLYIDQDDNGYCPVCGSLLELYSL